MVLPILTVGMDSLNLRFMRAVGKTSPALPEAVDFDGVDIFALPVFPRSLPKGLVSFAGVVFEVTRGVLTTRGPDGIKDGAGGITRGAEKGTGADLSKSASGTLDTA